MSDQAPSAENLLATALEISGAAERRAYLDRACAGDAALRQEVESLQAANEQAGKFMNATLLLPPTEREVDRLGRHKLPEQIREPSFDMARLAALFAPAACCWARSPLPEFKPVQNLVK